MRVGRLSPLPFIFGVVIYLAVLMAVTILFTASPSSASVVAGVAASAIYVALGASFVTLIIGRLHDAGYSGWCWPLVIFTALIGLIAVAAVRGSDGVNEYGVPPSGTLRDLLTFWRTRTTDFS